MRVLLRYRTLLITLGLVLVVLPFVGLALYNHPSLDDYLDAVTVKELGFWQAQKHFYLTHTGRYTTTVLLALVNPLLYIRLESHWWVALIFIFGTLLVLRFSLSELLVLPGKAGWIAAASFLSLWLAYAPGQAEGLYWFTGAYTYIMAVWLLLLWLVVLNRYAKARLSNNGAWPWLAALVVLTLAVAGTIEPVALPFLMALAIAAFVSWRLKEGRVVWLLAGLAAVGCLVSFSAPGNFARIASMGGQFSFLKTLCYSAATTGYLLLTWVGNPVLLALSALLLPGIHRIAQQRDQLVVQLLSRIPAGLLTIGMAGLMALASCPAYYASGTGLPLRARTTLYLLFLLGWFAVLLTWCCRQTRLGEPSPILRMLVTGRLSPMWTAMLVLFFFADYNVQTRATMLGQGSNNAIRAYRQWLDGEAAGYDAELRARYQALQSGAPVVTIRPLAYRPDLLYSFDIVGTDNPEFLKGYAQYFGTKQVISEVAAH
ncbi:DUF6056 family protein [Hymenobacter sp. BT770]|uniref:DUF6056 family protein n=1 Tax=Hymenobacter sp. BT770 TaxID=2886942 RepID=UPI001D124F78|nr:DUF6056 family protein [Hymenobacter sp. BT770]MCC3153374.1 DUF6056 family protein [Hymenobacter sp. BT770]MDO3415544.1 DUF6056 family protein [Hymenobacter sp. BT770]